MTDIDGLWAGTGEVDITPALGSELAGGFEPRIAGRIERRLRAKALALRDGADTPLLLISCDTILLSADTVVDRAKQLIGERTGAPAARVLVSATHAHSTPNTVPELGVPVVDPAEVDRLVRGIVGAAEIAVTTMIPARLAYGQTPVTGVCFNRRHRRLDGAVEFNPGLGRTDLVGPAGPVDPVVTAILVEDRQGTPLAFWANLALHYVGTEAPDAISSDYFGAVAERLQALVGHPVHVQLTNGCSGDINNVDLDQQVPVRGGARADLVATAVAGAVAASTMMAPRLTSVRLSSSLTEVELARVSLTDDDRRIAAEYLAGTREDTPFSYVNGMEMPPAFRRYFAETLAILDARPLSATAPVMAIGIGDLALVSFPGEVFVEHGLRLREQSPYDVTAMVGLANDHIGYLPTVAAFADGGYETWRNGVSWTAVGAGEQLVETALDLLRRHRDG